MFDWEKIDRIAEAASVLIMGGGRKAKESDQCLEADKCMHFVLFTRARGDL